MKQVHMLASKYMHMLIIYMHMLIMGARARRAEPMKGRVDQSAGDGTRFRSVRVDHFVLQATRELGP